MVKSRTQEAVEAMQKGQLVLLGKSDTDALVNFPVETLGPHLRAALGHGFGPWLWAMGAVRFRALGLQGRCGFVRFFEARRA